MPASSPRIIGSSWRIYLPMGLIKLVEMDIIGDDERRISRLETRVPDIETLRIGSIIL